MRSARAAFLAGLLYIALTLALTYPLVTGLGRFVPSDPGDPLLNTWILWWNAQTIPLTAAWWNAPAFFPVPDALAFSEHLLGLSLFTSPIIWLTGNPQLAYNIAFLLTFVLSGLGAYALGLVLTGRTDAALIAGLAYAFAPYRMAQFPHIQVLASFWMPAALAALHLFLREGRVRWLVLFGAATLLQGLTMGYYLLFFPILVGLWVLWFPVAQGRFRQVGHITLAFALACLAVAPFLLRYREVHERLGFARGIGEITVFSADITALFAGAPTLAAWGSVLREPAPEAQLFPGLTVIVLIVVAAIWARPGSPRVAGPPVTDRWRWVRRAVCVAAIAVSLVALTLPVFGPWEVGLFGVHVSVTRISRPISVGLLLWLVVLALSPRARALLRSQSPLRFYALATVVIWVLAFGPFPAFDGQRVVYWAPYRWLMLLPGFDGVRVPARFAMLAALTLAAAAAAAFARLVVRAPERLRPVLLVVVALCTVADGWLRAMPLTSQPTPSLLTPDSPSGAVLELPIGDVDVAAMYRGMTHRHPVANGYSGYLPPAYKVVRAGIESEDPDTLAGLAALGVRHVMVFRSEGAEEDTWNDYVQQHPGVVRLASVNGQTHYQLPPASPLPLPPPVRSHVPIAWVHADLYPEDAYLLTDHDVQVPWQTVDPQMGSDEEELFVGLHAPTRVAGVELALGQWATDYPRQLIVERSVDCTSWEIAWSGPTAAMTLAASLRTPLDVRLDIRFAPADAMCLRVRQTGHAREPWVVAELAVIADADAPGTSSTSSGPVR